MKFGHLDLFQSGRKKEHNCRSNEPEVGYKEQLQCFDLLNVKIELRL